MNNKLIIMMVVLIIGMGIKYAWGSLLYANNKRTTFEVKIVCTNDPAIKLEQKDIPNYLRGGRIIGKPFNTIKYRQCYIIAKYDPNTKPENRQAIDALVMSMP